MGDVSQAGLFDGAPLLGEDTGGAGGGAEAVEEFAGALAATDGEGGFDEPAGAEVEAAFGAWEGVVVSIAEDGVVDGEFAFDEVDGGEEARVVGREEA